LWEPCISQGSKPIGYMPPSAALLLNRHSNQVVKSFKMQLYSFKPCKGHFSACDPVQWVTCPPWSHWYPAKKSQRKVGTSLPSHFIINQYLPPVFVMRMANPFHPAEVTGCSSKGGVEGLIPCLLMSSPTALLSLKALKLGPQNQQFALSTLCKELME
jgi:hypothetical protein